jgi:hypothetical protein
VRGRGSPEIPVEADFALATRVARRALSSHEFLPGAAQKLSHAPMTSGMAVGVPQRYIVSEFSPSEAPAA